MRVIAGSARRLLLKTLPGDETRPTTDRIKETLFNMLQSEIPGSRFLDLFGGSGGIAIEALSRGASSAVIVEKNPKAARIIRENLEHTHLDDRAELLTTDASAAITRLAGRESAAFDLIFFGSALRTWLGRSGTCAAFTHDFTASGYSPHRRDSY